MEQTSLFDKEEFARWKDEWIGMPEFVQEDLTPTKTLLVHFASWDDMRKFAHAVGQKITADTQSIWYPEAEIGRYANKRYIDESTISGLHNFQGTMGNTKDEQGA